MRKILSLAVMVYLSANLFAQVENQDQPVVGTWEGEDVFIEQIDSTESHISVAYTQLEPQVLADIDWMTNTPMNENVSLRENKTRFLLMWMSGSPTVKIDMDDRIVTFRGAETWLLMAYMMGWTKYSLEHDYSHDPVDCATAGITTVVHFYEKNRKFLSKSRVTEKYARMVKANYLREYIEKVLAEPVVATK